MFGVSHEIVLGVVELQEYYMVDILRTVMSKMIKLIIEMSITLQLMAPGLGRHIFEVMPSLIVVDPKSANKYTSLN